MSNYDGNVDDLGEVKDKNQDDPWMHIEMLELRLSEGDYPGAEEEVRKIMMLGGENPEVNSETGDILARYEIWPYAAQFYMRSARLMTRPPSDIISKIQFTLYKSGEFDGSFEILAHADSVLDPLMLALLEARYELFFGDLDLASEKIQELLKQEPFLIYEIYYMLSS